MRCLAHQPATPLKCVAEKVGNGVSSCLTEVALCVSVLYPVSGPCLCGPSVAQKPNNAEDDGGAHFGPQFPEKSEKPRSVPRVRVQVPGDQLGPNPPHMIKTLPVLRTEQLIKFATSVCVNRGQRHTRCVPDTTERFPLMCPDIGDGVVVVHLDAGREVPMRPPRGQRRQIRPLQIAEARRHLGEGRPVPQNPLRHVGETKHEPLKAAPNFFHYRVVEKNKTGNIREEGNQENICD